MSSAALPDYYSQLGVAANASPEEVRKAYRALALRFHPDKAPQNPFAEAQFLRLKEAYEVLKDPLRRRRYDQERWLRGMPETINRKVITAQSIVTDARRLEAYVVQIGAATVNAGALQALCLFLLSEAHLALFWEAADPALNKELIHPILAVSAYLPAAHLSPVMSQLEKLRPLSPEMQTELATWLKMRQREARRQRLGPLWVLLLTLLLCLMGWAVSR
jgi:hypothetical protein